MKRLLLILIMLLVVALSAAVALWWRNDRAARSFYTDGQRITQRIDDAFVRTILWQPATGFEGDGGTINTEADEFEPRISIDGSTLLLVRKKAGADADLFIAHRDPESATGWGSPQPLIDINTDHNELGPTLSPDGRTLLFASDRPGGLGGFDLWQSTRGDFGWNQPINLGPEINSEHNEYGPAISSDGSLLLFSSNRPSADESPIRQSGSTAAAMHARYAEGDYDLYAALVKPDGFEKPQSLTALNTYENEGAPAFSPAGDFLYFCSDRPGGYGGFDLYRSRRLEGSQLAPELLGGEINTAANEMDPAPENGGFALVFSSDRAHASSANANAANQPSASRIRTHGCDLHRSESREVFVRVGPRPPLDFAALWAWLSPLLLWLLLLLLAVTLLAVSWKGVRSRKLGLLTRCLLASVLAHMILMTLLTFWQVTTTIAQMVEQGSATRIVLSAAATSGGGLAGQLRGGVSGDLSIAPREVAAANKAEHIEQSPGAAAEVVRLGMQRAAAGPEDASTLESEARESQHTAVDSPQTDVAMLAAIAAQQGREVNSPQDAHRDASAEARAQAQASQAPAAERLANVPRPSADANAGPALVKPSDAPSAAVEPVRVAVKSDESSVKQSSSFAPPPSSEKALTVETAKAERLDISEPRNDDTSRIAAAERRGPALQADAEAHASRAAGELVANAASAGAATGNIAVAPQMIASAADESPNAGIAQVPGDSREPVAATTALAGITSAKSMEVGDARSNDRSQIALPVDVAATGAGHGPEVAANVSATDARGSSTARAAMAAAAANPALGANAGAAVQTDVQTARREAPEAVAVGEARTARESSGENANSKSMTAAPSSALALQDGGGAPTPDGSNLATPSGGAVLRSEAAATQPGVGEPASALASSSRRRDADAGAMNGGGVGAGGLVAFAPGTAIAGQAGGVEIMTSSGGVNAAGDSTPGGPVGASAPDSNSAFGLDDGLSSTQSMAMSLSLPQGADGAGDATGDETAAVGPQVAAAGASATRAATGQSAFAGSGGDVAVALAPTASGPGSIEGLESAAAANGAASALDAARVGDAGTAAPSSDQALGLGDALSMPTLAIGELSIPEDGQGQPRGGPSDQAGAGEGGRFAASNERSGRAANDGASFAPTTGSVSIALSPDHLNSGGGGDDASDAATTSVTGAINDADEISGSNNAPIAAALTELALPDAAPGPDLNLRLPTDLQPPNSPYAARNEVTRLETVKKMGGSEETEKAVALALEWLARHQSPDGRWATRGFDADCGKCGGEGKFDTDVATTALALLCFLGADHTHVKEGRYKANVERGLAWLVGQQEADGDLRAGETMYSHGIASIAIAESLGMTGDPNLREPVRRAVEFIDAARNRNVGGWRYEPRQAGDTSVTGWQVMALMSAKRAGLPSRDDAFAAASSWMVNVSMPDRPGRYAYQPGQPPSPSMSAEGMFIQQLLGMPRNDQRMRGSSEYILENLPRWDSAANTYYWYYATLAMFQYQGDGWVKWNDELTRVLLRNQKTSGEASGSWDPADNWSKIGGRVYQTAICTLCLEVYYRYLPMYKATNMDVSRSMVAGTVTDAETGNALAGVTVRLDMSTGAGALVAVTDVSGHYALALPELPADFVALSASLDGYTPQTENIARAEAEQASVTRNFALAKKRSSVIVLETDPQVHHLGNNEFEGAINSQFQKQAEGSEYQAEFTLGRQQLPPNTHKAEFVVKFKGAQAQNSVFINDQRLGTRFNGAPTDGSFGEFRVEIPLGLLVEGVNTVRVRASASSGDLDDFEFVNVQIQFDADDRDR